MSGCHIDSMGEDVGVRVVGDWDGVEVGCCTKEGEGGDKDV